MERSGNFYKAIRLGYILISILIGCMAYNSLYEWQEIEALELGNKKIDELRKEINNINIQMIKFSLLGETILEWNDKDIEHYHARRMAMDSMLCRFKATYPAERIDSVRSLLEDKERQMFQIVRLMDEQQSINKKIANQIPVIVQKSVQEQSKKPKRKGFLGIFGKKKEVTPAVSTTILHSVNRNVISEQKVQDRQLSEQADSLAARNAELNRQLQELICQIEEKVQTELQSRENEIVAMREKSFMQVGGLMGFVLLLLLISYIIIHRDAKSIKQYKHKTTDLIRQLEQSVQRNEALITSRKKAVHTITHELRTPLTAITGYAGLYAVRVLPVNLSRPFLLFGDFAVKFRAAPLLLLVPNLEFFMFGSGIVRFTDSGIPVGFGCFLFCFCLFGFLLLLGDDEVGAFKMFLSRLLL